MMPARVSVAMCTCNGERFVRAQLDSLAGQTRRPDELVVCDDRSDDATFRIVEEWAVEAPLPVRLYRNTERVGSTKNFEKAIGLCTGTLIALSDQDDIWMPEKLAVLEREFENTARVGLVFADAEIVAEELRATGGTLWDALALGAEQRRRSAAGDAVDHLLNGATVTGATMAFRACFAGLVLPIPAGFVHDAWIALLIAAVADVLPIASPTIRYRQHAMQQIGAIPQRRAESGLISALRRPVADETTIRLARHALDRLTERQDAYESAAIRARLRERLEHFETRARLPANVLKRATTVAREFATRRYGRYSRGVLSAAKDLLGARSLASRPDRRAAD